MEIRGNSFQNNRYIWIIVIVLIILLLNIQNFMYYTSSSKLLLKNININKIAVIYALPTFHDEVVSVVSCMLHDLGYFVIVYIGSGIHIGEYILPYSESRKASSKRFYGRCVSKWITITPEMEIITQPGIVVFVTYPMLIHGGGVDTTALKMMKKISEDQSKTQVVMITHRTNEMFHSLLFTLDQYSFPHEQMTFLFLGEHTYNNAFKQIERYRNMNVSDVPVADDLVRAITLNIKWKKYLERFQPKFEYIYPVLPYEYVISNKSYRYSSLQSRLMSLYHSVAPESFSLSSSLSSSSRSSFSVTKTSQNLRKSTNHIIFVMQGNFGGRHSFRKDPHGVVLCLRSLEEIMPTTKIDLHLIGNLFGSVNITSLLYGNINFFSGLDSESYYNAISRSDYMLTALADREYFTTKATSSVPAALIANIPLVTSKDFLNIYPCLRDQPIHRKMAKKTDCESIQAATALTKEEYIQAKIEIVNCSRIFYDHGKRIFARILNTTEIV